MKNKNKFTLRLSDQQLETLKETAKQEKRTAAAVIRKLIDELKKTNTVCKIGKENRI